MCGEVVIYRGYGEKSSSRETKWKLLELLLDLNELDRRLQLTPRKKKKRSQKENLCLGTSCGKISRSFKLMQAKDVTRGARLFTLKCRSGKLFKYFLFAFPFLVYRFCFWRCRDEENRFTTLVMKKINKEFPEFRNAWAICEVLSWLCSSPKRFFSLCSTYLGQICEFSLQFLML